MSTSLDTAIRIERVEMDALPVIHQLNQEIFSERRIINQFDRPDLLMLLALADDEPVGFKIGYGESRAVYYSAKGGVIEGWRRRGVARALLETMTTIVRRKGYRSFAYDTFPNLHPGMTIMGLELGFRVTAAGYNSTYNDYRLRLEKQL